MSRRLWIAVGLSVFTHLALTLALLRARAPAPVTSAPGPIEIELLAAAEMEPAPPAPPEPPTAEPDDPAPPRPARPTTRPRARRTTQASPRETTPAPERKATWPAPADRFGSFRIRNQPLALTPKAPALPLAPRPGSFEALFNEAPDVLHHKTTESLVGVKRQDTGLEARVAPDGRITFKDPAAVKFTGLGLGFDVTEVAMKAMGDDPYAAQKRRIAEETREARFCLTLKDAENDKRNAIFRLKDNLERLVADRSLTDAEKRAAVFELWEGCLDTADDVLANAARATIVAFIRRAFPAGTASAYTPVELAMLNRRRNCSRPFDPYATRTPARRSPDVGADPQ